MKWQDQLLKDMGEIKAMIAGLVQSDKDKAHRIEVLEDQLEPIKKDIYGLKGVQKFLGLLAILFGILESAKIAHLF